MEVSPITRKHLTDELAVALSPTELVGRLFPIRELPSKDVRHSAMPQDIEMHCVHYPGDWSD